jgi:hypothetical protein
MTRAQLVDATYDAAERLNALKLQYGRVPKRRGMRVAQRIREARELRRRIAEHDGRLEADLKGEVARFSQSTVCDKRELFWPRRLVNFRIGEILRIGYRHYFPGRARTPALQQTSADGTAAEL